MLGPAEFFADHTFRMVFLGTTVIGVVAGALGCFPYLRRQSLVSDVVSHAALTGTLSAFLLAVTVLGIDGRNMVLLMAGAVVTGLLAVAMAQYVVATTRLAVDAALAVTMTLFFGAGMLLLRVIGNGPYPGKGGIQDYLFGNASVLTVADLTASLTAGGGALALVVLLWKEFALRTFDPGHSRVLGFNARLVDGLLFATLVVAIVIGVKAVGLVLMVAFVVTPPAAARQWTRNLAGMVVLAGLIGGVGSGAGAYLSIALGGLPTGPLICLTLFGVFAVSLLFAPGRSLIGRALERSANRLQLRRELLAERTAA